MATSPFISWYIDATQKDFRFSSRSGINFDWLGPSFQNSPCFTVNTARSGDLTYGGDRRRHSRYWWLSMLLSTRLRFFINKAALTRTTSAYRASLKLLNILRWFGTDSSYAISFNALGIIYFLRGKIWHICSLYGAATFSPPAVSRYWWPATFRLDAAISDCQLAHALSSFFDGFRDAAKAITHKPLSAAIDVDTFSAIHGRLRKKYMGALQEMRRYFCWIRHFFAFAWH